MPKQSGYTCRVRCPFKDHAQVNHVCRNGIKLDQSTNIVSNSEKENLVSRMEMHIYTVHAHLSGGQDRVWVEQAVDAIEFECWEWDEPLAPAVKPPLPRGQPPAAVLVRRGRGGGAVSGCGCRPSPTGGRPSSRSRSPLFGRCGTSSAPSAGSGASAAQAVLANARHLSSATLNELIKVADAELSRRAGGGGPVVVASTELEVWGRVGGAGVGPR
jgi:hypothetical protein